MLQKIKLLIISSACICFLATAYGQTKIASKQKPKPWSGSVHFGYVANSGNSRDTNALGKLKLRYGKTKWNAGGEVGGQFSSSKKGKTAQNYTIATDANYFFLPRHFIFGLFHYKYDRFDPYTHATNVIAGYGWKIIQTPKIKLQFKLGPGFRHQKEAGVNNTDEDITANAEARFEWKITKTATFSQTASTETGKTTTYNQAKSALTAKIIGNLGMEASFLIKNYSKIPPRSKNRYKTDTVTNLALVYNF